MKKECLEGNPNCYMQFINNFEQYDVYVCSCGQRHYLETKENDNNLC